MVDYSLAFPPGTHFNYFGISFGRRLAELQNNLYTTVSLLLPSLLSNINVVSSQTAEEAEGGACVCVHSCICVCVCVYTLWHTIILFMPIRPNQVPHLSGAFLRSREEEELHISKCCCPCLLNLFLPASKPVANPAYQWLIALLLHTCRLSCSHWWRK